MKAYELLIEEFEDKVFTDGISLFEVLRSAGGELHLYLKVASNPYKYTAREILELDFKLL